MPPALRSAGMAAADAYAEPTHSLARVAAATAADADVGWARIRSQWRSYVGATHTHTSLGSFSQELFLGTLRLDPPPPPEIFDCLGAVQGAITSGRGRGAQGNFVEEELLRSEGSTRIPDLVEPDARRAGGERSGLRAASSRAHSREPWVLLLRHSSSC